MRNMKDMPYVIGLKIRLYPDNEQKVIRKLEYKAELYGRVFAKVHAAGTTQTCSTCGYEMKDTEKLTLSDREWTCPNCKIHHNRDHNSAINIKIRGLIQS